MRVHWVAIIAAAPCILAAACGSGPTGLTADKGTAVLVNDLNDSRWPRDAITLDSAVMTPLGSVRLFTTFGGGCREHTAALLVDRAFMESQPPVLRARIAHRSNGDPCEALLSRTFEFDLAPVRQHFQQSFGSSTGSVVLDIDGQRVTYVFN